jgi:hypothetical protein
MNYTKKQKRAARKPDIVYTEYGRTVVKKAKSGMIRLTDADMRANAICFLLRLNYAGKCRINKGAGKHALIAACVYSTEDKRIF